MKENDDNLELTNLALHHNGVLGQFIGEHWPACGDRARHRHGRASEDLEKNLKHAVPLPRRGRPGTFTFYTTHDKLPREKGDDDWARKDMTVVLRYFSSRLAGQGAPLRLEDAVDILEARGHDMDLVARQGVSREAIVRFLIAVLFVKDGGSVDVIKKACRLCVEALERSLWSVSKFDSSIGSALMLGVYEVFMRTGDQRDVTELCEILKLNVAKVQPSAVGLWLAMEKHIEPTEECKDRFSRLFRMQEMGMGSPK